MTPANARDRSCSTCGTPAGEADRFCPMCGAALAMSPRESAVRRHVTVLFCDLAGFTRMSEGLDPEVLRAVMDRYFRLASKIVWAYGGATEKFIGDAVMAVFGMPVAREDDSVRAVQAALDVLAELNGLNRELIPEFGIELTARIGVNSGLVSATYDQGGDFRVVGDAVNTASRLQSAAGTNEVLVGESVAQLVRASMRVEEVQPLILKGKQAPVRAWRALPGSDIDPPPARGPFLGRELQMAQLGRLYERTVTTGGGSLAILLGPAGIGKSRIIAEFRAGLASERLCVLTGRARSYGRGISYAPISELIESAPGAWAAFESAALGDPAAERAVTCLRGLTQQAGGREHGGELEEVAWSLRMFLASAARLGTVLVIWEDLHWSEPALLDVIEYLSGEFRDLPVMQVCVGRPELREMHALLPGSAVSMTIEVPPLTPEESMQLVCELVGGGEVTGQDLDERCTRAAVSCEGNPLFAELMLDAADDPSQPPPLAITAVFAARLDHLDAADRLVLEMAAVAGRDFTSADILYLLTADGSDGVDFDGSIERLRRARLLTGNRLSARHQFAQAFSRDTTYELTAKAARLRWHQALAERADRALRPGADSAGSGQALLPGWDDSSQTGVDLLTYHLESAALLSRELRPRSSSCRELCIRAGAALAAQGADATNRRDLRAAAGLLERGLAVLPRDAQGRVELELRLSDTYLGLGMADRAGTEGLDGPGRVVLEIQREIVALRSGGSTSEQVLAAERHLEGTLAPDDDLSWCRFHQLRAHRHLSDERIGAAEASLALALERALALGSAYEADGIRRSACELAMWGPAPVAEGVQLCQKLVERFAESRVLLVSILGTLGGLLGLDGRFAEARQAFATAAGFASELRMRGAEIGLSHIQGVVESVAGEHRAAADHFGKASGLLAASGQPAGAALLDGYRSRQLIAAGDPVPDAYRAIADAALAGIGDKRAAALTSVLCAHAAVERGEMRRAHDLAVQAMQASDLMDDLFFQGSICQDAAIVLELAGFPREAQVAAQAAWTRYVEKGARAPLSGIEALRARLLRVSNTMPKLP